MKAVSVSRFGAPSVLRIVDTDPPVPGAGQVLVDVAAAGVNFMDVYARTGRGRYATAPPFVLGAEGAGRVVALGPDVGDGFFPGQRVVWKAAPGSYAQQVVAPTTELVPVPDAVDDETAAAVFLQGLTAHYLVHSTFPVHEGDVVVVHAAAGGVGLLLTQMATMRGARVIGTVSSAEKEALARRAGAGEVIRYDRSSVADAVRDLTGGAGAAAVYDGVGQAMFEESLRCLRVRGMLVLYGAASGAVPPFDLERLAAGGSVFVTRPTLVHYTRDREELLYRAKDLFDLVTAGRLSVHVGERYPLAEAERAHRDLQARATVGKLLLIP